MSVITKEIIQQLLEKCIFTTLEHVQQQVSDPLPEQFSLTLEAFGQHDKELSIDEICPFSIVRRSENQAP